MKIRHIAIAILALALPALAVNEITTSTQLQVNKGFSSLQRVVSGVQTTWTNNQFYGPVTYTCTQSWLTVSSGQITNMGWCHMRNVDTTNSVLVSFDAGTNSIMAYAPGESGLFKFQPPFPISSMAIKSSANGSNTYFEITIISK